jgi:hypothetical protein
MICARPGGAVTQVGFKPTAPRTSPTQGRGVVLRHVSARPASRRSSDADVRDWNYFLSLSLSLPTIKRKTPAEASFSPFSPSPR